MNTTQTKSQLLAELYTSCGLTKEDTHDLTFNNKTLTIITRGGIEKIQYSKGIEVTFQLEHCAPGFVVVKATGVMGDQRIETFGSASPQNSKNSYYPEMAEKRALSRLVLKLTKAYTFEIFGQDEADAFKESNKAVTS